MNKPFSYEEILDLAEEMAQLTLPAAQLQRAVGLSLQSYSLKFFSATFGERWVHFDLQASRPWMVSTTFPIPKQKSKPTPVQNFLGAHFVGLELLRVQIAQKPNRTLRFIFGPNSETSPTFIEWHAYPHRQKLVLVAGEKVIVAPARAPREKEALAFVDLDPPEERGWTHNDSTASYLLGPIKKKDSPGKINQSPQLAKAKKTLEKLDAARDDFFNSTSEKIKKIESEIDQIKLSLTPKETGGGRKLNELYGQIKKLKRSQFEFQERKNRIRAQVEILEKTPDLGLATETQNDIRSGPAEAATFKGVRISLDQSWQLWVGRNAAQNDELLKLARPFDIWIHLRDYPGAHGILRGPKNKEPSPAQMAFACRVVAQLSQGSKKKFQPGEHLDFILAPKKFVRKPKGAPPGQVLVEREKVKRVIFQIETFITL